MNLTNKIYRWLAQITQQIIKSKNLLVQVLKHASLIVLELSHLQSIKVLLETKLHKITRLSN
jgi:hypothetical protein